MVRMIVCHFSSKQRKFRRSLSSASLNLPNLSHLPSRWITDVLDEFSAKPQASSSASSAPAKPSEAQPTAASTSDLQPPSTSATAAQDDLEDADFDEEAFAKELEANMAALMKTFSGMADGGGGPAPSAAAPESTNQQSGEPPMNEEEMMKQFEAMMSEMGLGSEGGGLGGAPPSNTTTSKSATNPAPANYQDALKATMSRLKQSDASASASASGSNTGGLGGMFPGLENDEEMKKLLASLSGGGEGPDGESPEFAKMLENMMGELMGKEILYEPMKELASKVSLKGLIR